MRLETVLSQTALEPRPYQVRVVTKATKMFNGEYRNGAGEREGAARSVMLESPTGSGKTPMGLLASRYMQLRNGAHVGWVAMRRNLLAQAAQENEKHRIGAAVNYISMFTNALEEEHPDLLPGTRTRPLLLVCDEAQHDAANTMQALHNALRPEWVLGLSATPYRTDSVKLCFEKVVKDAGIHQLIQEGYLSRYHHYTVDNWNPEEVADHYAREPQRWGKSLKFFLTYTECCRWRDRMRHHGLAVDVVTGSTDREAQIAALQSGELVALANMAVLTEGFNYPDLQTVWVRDSSKGPTVQMGGRVFRQPDDQAIKFKQVVQSKNSDWPMVKTAIPHQQLVWQNGSWRTLQINPEMDRVSHVTRMVMARTELVVPAYFQDRIGRRGRVKTRRF